MQEKEPVFVYTSGIPMFGYINGILFLLAGAALYSIPFPKNSGILSILICCIMVLASIKQTLFVYHERIEIRVTLLGRLLRAFEGKKLTRVDYHWSWFKEEGLEAPNLFLIEIDHDQHTQYYFTMTKEGAQTEVEKLLKLQKNQETTAPTPTK